MSDFIAGLASRHAVAASVLHTVFAPPSGFAAVDPRSRVTPPEARSTGPKHFSPADRSGNPTAGWNPLDAAAEPTPYIDPVEAAHSAGFAEGYAAARAEQEAGRAEAEAMRMRDEALLTGIVATMGQDRFDREAMAAQLRETVLALVTRIVGEVGVAANVLAARVDAAAGLLSNDGEPAILRVHPDDVALLEGRLPASLFAVGDANVLRGAFVLESASTVVEDGPALWLEQLAAAIDRAPIPA